MPSPEKAGQIPEEAVELVATVNARSEGSNIPYEVDYEVARDSLQAAYPSLRDHFLQEFRGGLEEVRAILMEYQQGESGLPFKPAQTVVRPALERIDVLLVSLSQPVQEEAKLTGVRCESCDAEEREGDEGWESVNGLSWCINCFVEEEEACALCDGEGSIDRQDGLSRIPCPNCTTSPGGEK